MLLEAAIGDAYGSGYEFQEVGFIHENNTSLKYFPHIYWQDLSAGMYTDDTQMGIAVAEALINGASTELEFANSFVNAFKRDPRQGYSRRFYDLLLQVDNGEQLIAAIEPKGTTCGAAMRSLPLGFLPLDEILEIAKIQASVTHNTLHGIRGSQAIALASYFVRTGNDPRHVREFVATHLRTNMFDRIWTGPVSTETIDVVCAVFNVVETCHDQVDALHKAIGFTGDVDSVAALACGLLAPKYPLSNKYLIENLEQSTYARDYLVELESKLWNLGKNT